MLWLQVCRFWDWGQSKIPFYLAATIFLAPEVGRLQIIEILAMIAALASFGYGLNEIADRSSDARAGQHNFAAELAPADQYLFPLLTAGLAVVLSLLVGSDGATACFVLACLAISVAYSASPLRLKERGLPGLFAAALAQWSLPVFAVAASEPVGWSSPEAVILAALGLALGVRWMCIHQVQDQWADRVAGVRTYGALGRPLLKIVVLSLITEIVLLALLFLSTWPALRGAAAALLIWGIVDVALRNPLRSWRSRLQSYADAPLGSFYFLVFPMAMVIGYVAPSWGAWLTALIAALASHGLLWLRRRLDTRRAQSKPVLGGSSSGPPLERAHAFLAGRQSAGGGFSVRLGRHRDLSESKSFPCVFETAYLVNILSRLEIGPAAREIVNRARAFLCEEREPSGAWRYFLRGSLIPEEVDTIACALMVSEPDCIDDSVIERILANRSTEGPLRTWMVDADQDSSLRNGVDVCVNANVYTLLQQRSMDDQPIRKCLEQALVTQAYNEGSPYYHSPFFFLYAMAQIASAFAPPIQNRLRQEVISAVATTPQMDLLEAAQACTALTLTNADPALREPLLERLLHEQLEDGGWPAVAMCWGLDPDRFWCGSREMVTAFCMESLSVAVNPRDPSEALGVVEHGV